MTCSERRNAITMKFNVVLGLVATIGIMSTGVIAMPAALHERYMFSPRRWIPF